MSKLKDVAKALLDLRAFAHFSLKKNESLLLEAQKIGLKSLEQILAEREADNFEIKRAKCMDFFKAKKNKYWQNLSLSYSFLKYVDNVRYPEKSMFFGDPTKRFAVGRAFENMLMGKFEREPFEVLTPYECLEVAKLVQRAQFCPEIVEAVESYKWQKEFYGTIKGFKFKCKVDFHNAQKSHVLDTKTTIATTQKAFYKQCTDMLYFTQGVIYTDLAKNKSYTITGTSKKMLANFVVNMQDTEFLQGDLELDRLLENLYYFNISHYFKA